MPPQWWIADALCVHDGFHYRLSWAKGAPSYHLFGHTYWRTGLRNGWGEGAWNDNGPWQQGGMQMDSTFQQNYGAGFVAQYGNASRWPVRVQLLVAWRGWLVQGWRAWPNTSRACGLR